MEPIQATGTVLTKVTGVPAGPGARTTRLPRAALTRIMPKASRGRGKEQALRQSAEWHARKAASARGGGHSAADAERRGPARPSGCGLRSAPQRLQAQAPTAAGASAPSAGRLAMTCATAAVSFLA